MGKAVHTKHATCMGKAVLGKAVHGYGSCPAWVRLS